MLSMLSRDTAIWQLVSEIVIIIITFQESGWEGRGQDNFLLANGMKMRKRNGNTNALLFSLKLLEILDQERRGQVKTIVMEHVNGILFHKSRPANKQHTNQSIS